MADNHAPQPTSAAATISAASVPTSGISHPPAYVAVAGGYASVGGPGFPPPAAIPLPSQSVPAALPPSPVSGAPVHAYATAGVGTAAQQQQHTDYTSPQQQVTTVVPTGSYQGGGVVGSDGVNGAATGGSGGPAAAPETTPAAVTAAGTGTEATAGGGSTSSARDNGAPASGGSSKSSLKRGGSSTQSKPQSAWMLFIQDRREQVKHDNPDIAVTQQQKIMSEMWKTMSGNEKETYLSRAREDQKRYKADMAEKSLQPSVKKEDFYSNDERGQSTELVCPLGRIQRIIKLDQDVQSVTKEAAALIGKSMELFTALLAKEAFLVSQSQNRRLLKLQDIIDIMHNQDQFYWIKDDFPLPPR